MEKLGAATLEHVKQALRELGGEAPWVDILAQLDRNRNNDYTHYGSRKSYENTAFEKIQLHCLYYYSGKYRGGVTYFEKLSNNNFRLIENEVGASPAPTPVDNDVTLNGLPPEQREGINRFKYGSAGEGDAHKTLKEFVASNPSLLGLPEESPQGIQEFVLPSLDTIDVLFCTASKWIGVEVKPPSSDVTDQKRGIYQCVKYFALLQALGKVSGSGFDVRVVLILGGVLDPDLEPIRRILDIEVIENVTV